MNWSLPVKKMLKLTAAVIITTSLLASASLPPTAYAATHNVQEQVSQRSKQDMINKWQTYLPQQFTIEQLFKVNPTYTRPHTAGQLNDSVLQDALNATNFARYLAGLPDDVTLDYSIAEQQQAGAVLMAEIGGLSHYPQQPAMMAEGFYQLGYDSARTSNLSAGRSSLYHTVFFGYMADNSGSNLYSVGHRRWIINPSMKTTMFGMAYNPSSRYSYYSTMHAFNRDRDPSEVEYQYIAWPSAGTFPVDVLSAADPWSISPNPSIYDRTKTDEIYVTMSRESDQKTWTLNAEDRDENGDFFLVETGGYGVNFAIIFRPKEIGSYEKDDVYHVTIHNLYTLMGEKTSLSYSTDMMKLQANFKSSNLRYALVGQQLQLPVEGIPTIISSSDPSIASVDNHGVITAHKEGRVQIKVDNFLPNKRSSVRLNIVSSNYSTYSKWAEASILQANEIGLLQNNPYQTDLKVAVTRVQFVEYVIGLLQSLHPMIESELDSYNQKDSPFTDVRYNNAAITWAYEHGIINGTSKDKFSPDDTITREQAAALLLNVYRYLGGSEKPTLMGDFADQHQVASWAQSAVKQAVGLSIMGGISDTRFDPKGKYAHEQTIVTLLRLYKRFAE